MATIQREVRKRGFFGFIFKWAFILFNFVMAVFLALFWSSMSEAPAATGAETAAVVLGGAIGTSMVLWFWVLGDIVLGMLVFFTRGRRILITEEMP